MEKTFKVWLPGVAAAIGIAAAAFVSCNNDSGGPLPSVTYTVSYDANGEDVIGTPPASETVSAGDRVTVRSGDGLSRGDLAFISWNTEADGTGKDYNSGAELTVTDNITLYAQWGDPNKNYTITYNANGGSGTPPAETVTDGSTCTVKSGSGLTKSGFVFTGWNTETDGSGTAYNPGAVFIVRSDVTLYAQWESAAGYTFSTPEQYRGMAPVAGVTITGSGSEGVFIEERTVTLSAYNIAKYETTYELWYEVKIRADSLGYAFTRQGAEGSGGTEGAAPTEAAKTNPVCGVSWFDAAAWCNAYSELSGKTPVYTVGGVTFKGQSTITPDSASWPVLDTPDITRSGFRLPTEAEWEAAARGGNLSAAAWTYTYAGSDNIEEAGWYKGNSGGSTHAAGTKAANSAGLYDMTGNDWEWCWDWHDNSIGTGPVTNPTGGSSDYRVNRGGGWVDGPAGCTVSFRGGNPPNDGVSFRVVCAP